MRNDVANTCPAEQLARVPARRVICRGDADDLIAFLELVGGPKNLLILVALERPVHTADVGEDVLAGLDVSQQYASRRRRSGITIRGEEHRASRGLTAQPRGRTGTAQHRPEKRPSVNHDRTLE
jgi:hypothetical protein